MTTACRFSAGCCCFKNIFSYCFVFPFVVFCRFLFVVSGFGSGVFPPAGEDRLLPCWVFIVFVLFPIDFVVFFLSLSLPLSLCRFPFVVPGFWSGVFPSAGEDRLLPCWFFIVFVLFLIDFVVFFLSLSLSLSLCRFPFVVPGFWSGVFPPAGEDRLLPCWFFIVFVLFPIDFVVFFSFYFVVFSLFLLGMLR